MSRSPLSFLYRITYACVKACALPVLIGRLFWRGRAAPLYRRHIGERFGFYKSLSPNDAAASLSTDSSQALAQRGVIWIHAVSVGETRAAAPIIRALKARHPETPILLTHMTATGRATGVDLFHPDGVALIQTWSPYDYRFAVDRFLKHFRPKAALLMETEVWPTMIESCRRASIPAFLINARLSERSAKGYAKHAAFTRPIFAALSGVAAQTKADATRLAAVGANNITVTGNVKFDVAIPSNQQGLGETFRARFGGERRRPIFLAASTREGEETLVLDALSQATLPENAVTVIVPRHPERFKAVAALLKERELAFVTRSQNIDVPDHVKYVIGDSMGEMLAYYLAADIAFVGGSLLPLGGQNLIEPLAAKTPTLIGAHTFNFQEIAQLAVWAGAAVRVESAASLIEEVAVLLNDKDKQNKMIHAGEAFLAEHRGATDRLMSWLEEALTVQVFKPPL